MLLYYSKCWAEEKLIVELLFAVLKIRTVLNKMSFKINPRVKFTDEGILRGRNMIQKVLNGSGVQSCGEKKEIQQQCMYLETETKNELETDQ